MPAHGGGPFVLNRVNQLWAQRGLEVTQSYLDLLATNYGAGVYALDFADSEPSRQLINTWVAENTADRVRDLLPPGSIDSNTRFVLTNAIYFKASWLTPFDPKSTENGVFNAPNGPRSVRMMHQSLDVSYAEGEGYQALMLPYVSDQVRMMVVLPGPSRFEEVRKRFDHTLFDAIRQNATLHTTDTRMPAFAFSYDTSLKAPLEALGIVDAFKSNTADFSGFDGTRELYLTDAFHRAFLSVDEQGTEAAAATAVIGGAEFSPPAATVTLDRPFLFAIYDEPTGQILFVGQLVEPA